MGLDGVEIVMAFEETFGIAITDGEAEKTLTPGAAVDLIFSKLQATDEKTCQSQRAFYILRKAFMRNFGVDRTLIKPDSNFRKWISQQKEKDFWIELRDTVHARSWPNFARPRWLAWLLIVLTLMIFATSLIVFATYIKPVIGGGLGFISGTVLSTIFGFFAEKVTRPFKIQIPAKFKKIRDLVPYAITSDKIKWTREQVSRAVKKIVLEQLGISESKYHEDARFVEDLGLN